MKLPRLDRPGRYYLPAGTKIVGLPLAGGKAKRAKRWCPGYSECAIVAKGFGREVTPGMCRWCEENPGKRRPPVRGQVRLEWVKITDTSASTPGGQA
jgi:hypothetical protein